MIVSETTQRLIADHFDTLSPGNLSLKGKAAPVGAWQVIARRAARSRIEIGSHRGLTPLAGRADEMSQLLEAFEHTQRGDGRILFVTGEPGIGKSRLLHELRRRLGDGVSWMEGRCASLGRSIAFHPLIDLLKRTFGIEEGAAAETAADRIDRGVRRLGEEAAEIVPYLCWLLSIDSGDPSIAAMDPQTRRGETHAALRRVLELAAQARPLVLVLEDLHWSDVATEDFLIGLSDTIAGQQILVILTHRPGYEHRLGNRPYASEIALHPSGGAISAGV